MLRIYLDNCCLNRPFDDQNQLRIKLESDIILSIFEHLRSKKLSWVGSEILEVEVNQVAEDERKKNVLFFLKHQTSSVKVSEAIIQNAKNLEKIGISFMDALHLSSAESANVDYFITTDDDILKRFSKIQEIFKLKIVSPIDFIKLEPMS